MNWLMYIGGGVLWFAIWNGLNKVDKKEPEWYFLQLSAMAVWIWICWRFIR